MPPSVPAISPSATYDNAPVQIFDPNTNQPFAGNIIPASRISAQAKALLALYPEPNFSNPYAEIIRCR